VTISASGVSQGDWMLIAIMVESPTATITPPPGWTAISTGVASAVGTYSVMVSQRAYTDAASSYTVSWSTSAKGRYVWMRGTGSSVGAFVHYAATGLYASNFSTGVDSWVASGSTLTHSGAVPGGAAMFTGTGSTPGIQHSLTGLTPGRSYTVSVTAATTNLPSKPVSLEVLFNDGHVQAGGFYSMTPSSTGNVSTSTFSTFTYQYTAATSTDTLGLYANAAATIYVSNVTVTADEYGAQTSFLLGAPTTSTGSSTQATTVTTLDANALALAFSFADVATSYSTPTFTAGWTQVIYAPKDATCNATIQAVSKVISAAGASGEVDTTYSTSVANAAGGVMVTLPSSFRATTSGFSYSATGLSVQFTDQSVSSTGITTWAWSFGDGGTSNQQSPEHLYQAPGTYTVQLTVTDSAMVTSVYTQIITILYTDISSVIGVQKGKPLRWFIGDWLTGAINYDLPATGSSSWGRDLTSGDKVHIEVLADSLEAQALDLYDIARVRKSMIGVAVGQFVLACTPLETTQWNESTATFILDGSGGLRDWLKARVVTAYDSAHPQTEVIKQTITYKDISLGTIAKRLVQAANSRDPGTGLPIVYGSDVADPGTTRTYNASDLSSVEERIEELTNVINGPDIDFQPTYVDESGSAIQWLMRTGTPTQPMLYTGNQVVFLAGVADSGIKDITLTTSGTTEVSRAWLSSGFMQSGDADLADPAHPYLWTEQYLPDLIESGWALWEDVDTSHTDVVLQGTLDAYGEQTVTAGVRPMVTLSFSANMNVQPFIGSYILGDWVTVRIRGSRFIPNKDYTYRVISISGDANGQWVSIQCQPGLGDRVG
jgi:PKD repeat protein